MKTINTVTLDKYIDTFMSTLPDHEARRFKRHTEIARNSWQERKANTFSWRDIDSVRQRLYSSDALTDKFYKKYLKYYGYANLAQDPKYRK